MMSKEIVGYVPEPCINCNRVRVEEYTDGSLICEKCLYNQIAKEFVSENYSNDEILGLWKEGTK